MSDDLRKESEELLRYYGEIVRRIGAGGVSDVASLLTLYDQLREGLDAIDARELGWFDERARHLIEKLNGLLFEVDAMRRLKASVVPTGNVDDGSSPERS